MKLRHLYAIIATCACGSLTATASDFFNTGEYEGSFLTVGARVGFNTSNMADDSFGKTFNLDSWGTGFDAGVIVDLHLRDWISVQPGFFFQSRSNNFSYVYDKTIFPNPGAHIYANGHTRRTLFKIPIMASVHFHPAECLVWNVDIGPVLNYGIGGHRWYYDPTETPAPKEYEIGYYDDFNRFMLGLKMGTGFLLMDHYYLGIHYEAGLRSARKYSAGGHDKAWTFTIGYDF